MDSTATDTKNITLLQAFEWYAPADGNHWRRLTRVCESLKRTGIDYLWLPPGCKAGWQGSNGYDTYDLYDLGEFYQKDSRRTKWGDIEDLIRLKETARTQNIGLLWDAVLNHKSAADFVETCRAVAVDKENRLKVIKSECYVDVWTGYNFAGRADRYSTMKYHWQHFSGTDWEAKLRNNDHLYQFIGPAKPGWARDVDDSLGNSDYLMGNDLDYSNADVCQDVSNWGVWIARRLGLAGFRLDAVKHFSSDFLQRWIANLDNQISGPPLIMIGEYWRDSLVSLGAMIEKFKGRLHLFDVTLATNMSKLSIAEDGDMRDIMSNTLMKNYPGQAVPFVINHDTQSRYERDHEVTAISSWFIPLAYAFILLRADSMLPCVFYGDLYGIQGEHSVPQSCSGQLPRLILTRKLLAYGPMYEYLDQRNCIGFTRTGRSETSGSGGLAVCMANAQKSFKKEMYVGEHHAGEVWTDILCNGSSEVVIDANGRGVFSCGPKSVSVWSQAESSERLQISGLCFNSDIYNSITV